MTENKGWRPTRDSPMGYAMAHKPTRRERFWRFLGYRFHLGDEPVNAPQGGWISHTTIFHLCWRDRLRLLVTGKFKMGFILYTDTVSPNYIKARADWHILPPGNPALEK